MHQFLSGLNRPILFLKATHKKQVWIPQFSKKDGTVVGGHFAMVHVADDHDNAKVASGQGTHSQKKAHAALASVPGFGGMPVDHQAAAVMYHATEIQDKASASAKESVAKKKAALLASQLKAIASVADPVAPAAPAEPKGGTDQEVDKIVYSGSSWTLLSGHEDDPSVLGYTMEEVAQKWLDHNPSKAHELASTLVDLGYLQIAKKLGIYVPPNAKGSVGAMLAAKKTEGTSPAIAAVLDKITAAKLPESNTNHKPVNQKLDAIHAAVKAGDVKTLLMHGYGSNTYAVKAAKLANEALAVLGSEHKVVAGQKMGTHAGLSGSSATVEPKPEPKAPSKVVSASVKPSAGPAALLPSEIPATSGKLIGAIAAINGFAKVGDLYGLQQYTLDKIPSHNLSALNHAQAVYGLMKMKLKLSNSLKTPKPAKAAAPALKTQAEVSALSASELPPKPKGALSHSIEAINAIAKLGNVDGLIAFQNNLNPTQTKSKAYAAAVIKLMKEKQTKTPFSMDAPAVEPQPHHQTPPAAKTVLANLYENTQDGHSKFWAVHVDGSNMVTTYGKIGTNGTQSVKPFASPAAAAAAAGKMAEQKKKGGYLWNGSKAVNKTPDKWVPEVAPTSPKSKVGLSPDEMPPASSKCQPAYVKQAQVLAVLGDMDGLQKFADNLEKDGYEHSSTYATSLHNILYAKNAGAVMGPDEGDTKAGKGGTLVFHNGHWVLQDEASSDRWDFDPSDMGLSGQPSLTAHLGEGGDTVYVCSNGSDGFEVGHLDPNGSYVGEEANNFFTLAEAVKHAESIGAPHFSTASLKKLDPSFKGKAPVKAKKLVGAKVKATEPTPTVISGAESINWWMKTSGQKGYNEGGVYTDPNNVDWYCKFPAGGEKVVKNELLASKLYALAGVENAEVKMIIRDGKVGIASKIVIDAKEDKAALLAGTAKGLMSGFAVDAWLANWDAVGNNPNKGFDNILIKPDGSAVRIDAGGALMYGGAGGKKQTFGEKVIELKTMLDPAKNANTAAVFGKMSKADIVASVAKVVAISDQSIIEHCKSYAPGTAEEKTALANKLIARKADMLATYPMAGKIATKRQNSWVNLNPGEKIVESGEKFGVKFVKIEIPAKGFNAAGIPSPYTYDKSSSKFVNDQNTNDIKAIYDKAMTKVSPDAITNMDFDQIVKETGEKTGLKIKVDQHPSKAYVKEYLTQVASELAAQMKPTYRVEHSGSFADSYNNAARSIAQSVSALKFEQFKAWKTKAADYLVLDAQAGDGVPTPEVGQFHEVEPTSKDLMAFKSQSDAGFNKLNESEKKACKAYTGSAYVKWNEAMRTGDIDSQHFANGAQMRSAFSKAAVDLPDGIILHRGIGVGGETYKSVVGAVIQDGSFQSCSYGSKAAFSGHQSQLRLHVTKGVKGMMATSFSNFGTAEREIILHPNCRYVVMKVTNVNGKNVVDVLVLPHKG